ncbi:NUDIX hydrolase [Leucothrix arctica]|uniref:NUDIX hydrolase n=1 Tax=Leucothrix arctica TaxID=1481894 RepID=UPI00130495E2|nr:CoA pyrophosphatase [Leucothrix arctica]
MSELATLSQNKIIDRLKKSLDATYDVPPSNDDKPMRQAAVLVPFVEVDGEWSLLFIQRSEHENDCHSGQVAFAGGRYEESDEDMFATALRETHEEIGVLPEDVTVLGQLNHHYSISNYQITPVVATMPWPYDLTLEEAEVAATFTIPLRWLTDTTNYRVEERILNGKSLPVVYFEPYDGYVLWGATARMTLSLIDLMSTNP